MATPKKGKSTPVAQKIGKSTPVAKKSWQPGHARPSKAKSRGKGC